MRGQGGPLVGAHGGLDNAAVVGGAGQGHVGKGALGAGGGIGQVYLVGLDAFGPGLTVNVEGDAGVGHRVGGGVGRFDGEGGGRPAGMQGGGEGGGGGGGVLLGGALVDDRLGGLAP